MEGALQRWRQRLGERKLDAELWCRGRSPWLRLALLGYLGYAGVRHLGSDEYRSWFSGITLAFHEMGHILCSPLGDTMHLLGGSLLQILVPLAAAAYLLVRQGDYFGFGVGGAWLSFSLWELAVYIADASREQLPLVGFSDNPLHDWSTLLTNWHLLNHDATIAAGVRVCATVSWLGSVALGGWLCWQMWSHRQREER
jgi:hypothetical protein